ncbi:MAG TPA: FAD-dependent monooxygenase [Pseudonocardiaceae bacterium]|jgi:2-polyprenyl-6-methoxyphenol hydroxylase-like FAD-dependent oxidoreductase|nr:FAD-dependent monooxygenase [Pseudonocardiaceae bacterium]
MRVIVIGAGLGGLALAQALRGKGVDVEVHERDAGVEARFQGYRIGLSDQAVADVRGCLPERLHALLLAISGEATGPGRMVDSQLVELGRTPARDEGLLFDRHVLRHLLLADLADQVRFDRHFTGYTELPDGRVLARFADGSELTADLLVGADGMGSTVRRQLLPDVQIVDAGVSGAIGRTMLTERFADLVPGWSTLVVGDGLQLFLGKMPFRRSPAAAAAELAPDVHLPDTSSYLRWVMLMPIDRAATDLPLGIGPMAALDGVLDLIRDWHPELRALIEHADRDNSGVGPLRVATPIGLWPTGAVTLLGDAAHPMPPGGLGANLAFQDARLLTAAIIDPTDRPAAVADYEQRMRAYAAVAREEAMGTLAMLNELKAPA